MTAQAHVYGYARQMNAFTDDQKWTLRCLLTFNLTPIHAALNKDSNHDNQAHHEPLRIDESVYH